MATRLFFYTVLKKNQPENLTAKETAMYKLIAKTLLGYSSEEIEERLKENSLIEISSESER